MQGDHLAGGPDDPGAGAHHLGRLPLAQRAVLARIAVKGLIDIEATEVPRIPVAAVVRAFGTGDLLLASSMDGGSGKVWQTIWGGGSQRRHRGGFC